MSEKQKYDKIYLGNLLVYYEAFLTDKQREYLRLYYQEDYSLQEIAEIYQVTRTGIHNQIQHAQTKLLELEAHVHTAEIQTEILPLLETGVETKDWQIVEENVKKLREIMKEME